MTRLVLSFICGVAIPFIYSVVVGPLTNYTDNFTLRRLGYIPIGWPRLFLEKIVPLNSFPFRDQDEIAFLVFMIGSNIFLYGFLSYVVISTISHLRTASGAKRPLPPPPPSL